MEDVDMRTGSEYMIREDVVKDRKDKVKEGYEERGGKIEKCVGNELKESYESFELLEGETFDHEVVR
ncbi:hypothetical protein, partial [Staphylococcus saprophyticus]|uniref:hypothetical protein n=1 Tax=Staphylococcus saprophyticus TaxID=29385 RepID=UPI001643486D